MKSLLYIVAVALIMAGCTPADDNNDDGTTPEPTLNVSLEAQPWTVPADGTSQVVLFVECRNNGNAIADSTEVILLNSIGTLQSGVVLTRAGIALDTLTADTSAALGYVIAYCAGVRDTVEIQFTAD